MTRTLIADLNSHLNEEVVVKGWVERIRELSSVTFLILRDRTGGSKPWPNPAWSQAQTSTESVVELREG